MLKFGKGRQPGCVEVGGNGDGRFPTLVRFAALEFGRVQNWVQSTHGVGQVTLRIENPNWKDRKEK